MRHLSEEHKQNISKGLKGKQPKNVVGGWNKGLKGYIPQEQHPKWKGGISLGANRKEYMRRKRKEWLEKNYELKLYQNRQRRSRKANAPGDYTLNEWEELKKSFGNACAYCKRNEPDVTLTADHIIPLVKGGTNYITNIQPLCGVCNSWKGARLISLIPPAL